MKKLKQTNDLSTLNFETFTKWFYKYGYPWQVKLLNSPRKSNRTIIGKRQTGLTWYFVREAFSNAVVTGKNQIFISDNTRQAKCLLVELFNFLKELNLDFEAFEYYSYSALKLSNGAVLYFLTSRAETLGAIEGDVYVCDYLYIKNRDKINTLASIYASKNLYTKTYFCSVDLDHNPIINVSK